MKYWITKLFIKIIYSSSWSYLPKKCLQQHISVEVLTLCWLMLESKRLFVCIQPPVFSFPFNVLMLLCVKTYPSTPPWNLTPGLSSPTGAGCCRLPWKPGWWWSGSRRNSHPRCLTACSCPPRSRRRPSLPGAKSLPTCRRTIFFNIIIIHLVIYEKF